MKLLAIDTSTSVLTIGVTQGDRLLGEYTTNLKRNHSVRLMPSLEFLLQELNIKPQELDMIAVGVGPGSYTGVRIGVTTAKAMAWALHIPVLGVSSLQAMALGVGAWTGLVCPLVDARRGQVYTGLYRWTGEKVDTVKPDQICLLTDWLNQLEDIHREPIAFVGEGVDFHRETLLSFKHRIDEKSEARDNAQVLMDGANSGCLKASFIARVVRVLNLQGNSNQVYDLVPNYTQLAEAEAKWLAAKK
jgi:tRNA threonylcarbamoyladenosine biosynthesis protein TsaB